MQVVPNPLDSKPPEARPATDPARTEDLPRLGNYELLRRLGQGGMAEVHLARAAGMEGFQKLVVLKRILPHLAADPEFVRMFLAEGRLAAFLDHPNIVHIFDIGTASSDYYLAMEFVYGENLRTILRAARTRGEPVPIEHAVTIGIGVALGLHDAHEAVGFDGTPLHLVHRDVSPTNILVSYDGAVKVADFGIAKVAARTDVTQAGVRKGKVPFMSPEQCLAAPLDRRSDVFSLGIVLYEATTMQRLFDGDNEFVIMNQIMNGMVPPPSTRRPGYPMALERIVMKALARDRHNRYASTAEVAADLEQFAFEHKLRATQASLGAYMHQVFAPKPFPFGALAENPAPEREADDSGSWAWGFDAGAGSAPDASIRVMGTEAVVDRDSHRSNKTPMSRRSSAGTEGHDDTLRKIVTAVGGAAAFAVVLVLGAWLYLSIRSPASHDVAAAPTDTKAAAPLVQTGGTAPIPSAVVVRKDDNVDPPAPADTSYPPPTSTPQSTPRSTPPPAASPAPAAAPLAPATPAPPDATTDTPAANRAPAPSRTEQRKRPRKPPSKASKPKPKPKSEDLDSFLPS